MSGQRFSVGRTFSFNGGHRERLPSCDVAASNLVEECALNQLNAQVESILVAQSRERGLHSCSVEHLKCWYQDETGERM